MQTHIMQTKTLSQFSKGVCAQSLRGVGNRLASSKSNSFVKPSGSAPSGLGDGCSVSAKRVSSTCPKILIFLFIYASLVGHSSASRDSSFNVGFVQRQIMSCMEQAYTLAPVTAPCDVDAFACHVDTTTTATVDSESTNSTKTTTLYICRYPMTDRFPMEFPLGMGLAAEGVAILLPASAPTSSRTPPAPEDSTVYYFKPPPRAEWEDEVAEEEEEEEDAESDLAFETATTHASVEPLLLEGLREFDRVTDYGFDCPTTLLTMTEADERAPEEDVATPEDEVVTPKSSYHEAVLSLLLPRTLVDDEYVDEALDGVFAPHHLTAFQRIGAVHHLLYPRVQTSQLTPVHSQSMTHIEPPNNSPVSYPFWDDVHLPAAVRSHRLLRTPPPPAPLISELMHVQAQGDRMNLLSVRFRNRKWLDELIPTTMVQQCFFKRRLKRHSWVHDHVWPVKQVLPNRMYTSVATRANRVAPLAAPLVAYLGDIHLPSPALYIAQPPVMLLDELPNTGGPRVQASWPFGISDADLLWLMGIDMEPTNVPADLRLSNTSHGFGMCYAADSEDKVTVRSSGDDIGLPAVDVATSSTLCPAPTSDLTSTPTWSNIAILLLVAVVVAALTHVTQLRRDRDAWEASAKAFQRESIFRGLQLAQTRHRAALARVSRAHRRLRAPDASEKIFIDLAAAPISRRGAIRRLRPRSAVRPLVKGTSVAVAQPKRPLSARETARKSTAQQQCLGAFLAA